VRAKLEYQADRIETVLTMHKIPARVTGGTVTPRWVRFQVLPAVGARISKIRGLSEELAAALDTSNCRIARRGAAVDVEVARDDPELVRLLPLYRHIHAEGLPPITALLGLAEDGGPLLIRLPSPDVAHMLVSGTTGSGKTALLQAMILSLAMLNRRERLTLVLIDGKGSAFRPFEGLPQLSRPVIGAAEEAEESLESLVRLMERRSDLGGSQAPSPRVVVVIDELADLMMTADGGLQATLTRLLQRGREAGIHVVAATQKPTAAVLGSLVKANFPVRLVGRVASATDARVASGWSSTGAERLEGRGDFIAVAEGRVTRFQTAYVSREEIRETVAWISGQRGS
jgi:S-DNA-T family DNA segregation ATPase FtsK/SpoIIIE